MTNILAIANQMLEVSEYRLSNLKLQKLLYYVYGVNLVLNPEEEISEGPQAWDYGPVFPSVYHAFKKYGADLIEGPTSDFSPFDACGSRFVRDVNILEIIDLVYSTFGPLSESDLIRRTHSPNTPWYKFYQAGNNNVAIRKPTMRKYFEEHVIAN